MNIANKALLLTLTLFLAIGAKRAPSPLDPLAEAYVHLSLEAGERSPGYVDAYYGPQGWADDAKAHPRTIATLTRDAAALSARAKAIDPAALNPDDRRRRTFLIGQLRAAETRLAMVGGRRFTFADEAEGLFAVRPLLKALPFYDGIINMIGAIVPGDGPLWQRVDAFQNRYVIPHDRIEPVMRAAIAECRARTAQHIALPAQERFDLELVKGKPWSGYNWYKGNAHSLIQINTDLPIRIDRAIDLGCHEGYPGHHALNMLLERRLARAKGWVEFTVYPLFSPQSLIAEGSANYGIELAFPGKEKAAFEAARLYPLAGLDPKTAVKYDQLLTALHALAGARMTIALAYLDGRIDKPTALDLIQRYQLISRARAEQSLSFTETYRSYVINYGLGQDMVARAVELGGPTPGVKWQRMEAIIAQPTVPADLAR